MAEFRELELKFVHMVINEELGKPFISYESNKQSQYRLPPLLSLGISFSSFESHLHEPNRGL